MTTEELNDLFLDNDKVLIKFGASWCGPCKAMEPILEEIKKERPDVKVLELDVDSESELVNLFRIRSVPTLFWIKEGVTVDKLVGGVNKETILSLME